jgi:tRNA A-37 threonylcarbamoyl transferase component Bud32
MDARTSEPVSVVSRIGQYRIIRELGAGGMGTVFLGEHMLLKRWAAIKALRPALSAQRAVVDRFFNEARATSAISDPGVVQIFDFGYHVDGTAFIVMEFLEGESLADRIDRLGTLPLPAAMRIARQLAGSLAAAHAHGIVHRDLKPENVFVCPDPEAQGGERTKVLDFGICKTPGDGPAIMTMTGEMLGTPVYMSPEQCRGQRDVDHRADIYALGGVMFHMLAGRPPFEAEGIGEYIAAHLREDAPVPSSLILDLPGSIDALIARCLAKSPDDRFQSMAELQAAIDDVLAEPVAGLDALAAPPAVASDEVDVVIDVAEGTPPPAPVAVPRFAFTPTPAPIPTTLGSTSGQVELVIARRSRLFATIALVLVLGVITAVVATFGRTGGGDDASAAPAPRPAAAVEPAPAVIPIPVPVVAPVDPTPVAPPSPVTTEPTPAPVTSVAAPTTPIVKQKPAASRPAVKHQRRVNKPRPRPRPAVTPTEDLYDTR